ncbi:MAG: hypothetical protein WBQ16_04235 [Nitrososphaeraceae archaeon]
MAKHRQSDKTIQGYIPSARLSSYLKEKLSIERYRMEGKVEDADFTKRKRNNDRMKVEVLDKIIFPSMANIVYYFEQIKNSRELQKVFEEDIQELLLGRKEDGPTIFKRLLEGILTWKDYHIIKSSQFFNFRAELFHIMLEVIFYRVPSILKTELPLQVVNTILTQDLGRAWAWTEILRKKTANYDNDEASRKVQF